MMILRFNGFFVTKEYVTKALQVKVWMGVAANEGTNTKVFFNKLDICNIKGIPNPENLC